MARPVHILLLTCGLAVAGAAPARAQSVLVDRDAPPQERPWFVLPYAFQSDVLDTAFGAVVGGTGIFQEQTAIAASAIWSTNDSYAAYVFAENLQLPWGDRFFFSPRLTAGSFGDIESFRDGNPRFPDERAGTNGSNDDNFVRGEGTDEWYRVLIKYVLPMGDGKHTIVPRYVLDRGLLVEGANGGHHWNPFRSGRMVAELEPFYREQDVDIHELGVTDSLQTGGVIFTLRHENVDFLPNPSTGRITRFSYIRDPGIQGRKDSYRLWEFEWAEYLDFGESERFRQRVLALNFWTADTPSWKKRVRNGEDVITHRPPDYFGATLGGVFRMRAYKTSRFNDKAAIYYSAELRLIPRWNPLADVAFLRDRLNMKIDWLQVVPFVEVGRVANSWNLEELHSSMKWSAGVSIRGMVNFLIVRADIATSPEGVGVQMMVSHPFPSF